VPFGQAGVRTSTRRRVLERSLIHSVFEPAGRHPGAVSVTPRHGYRSGFFARKMKAHANVTPITMKVST
jgi:hypothetical protein